MNVQDLIDQYRSERTGSNTDRRRAEQILDQLGRRLGAYTPDQLTPAVITAYGQQRGVSPGTLRLELGRLVAVLKHAERHRRIDWVPPIALPSPPAPKERWLERDEVDAIRHHATPRISLYVLIAVETGARPDSIRTLRWAQVDLARRRIDFGAGRAQTKKRRPTVPISDTLYPELVKAHKRATTPFVLKTDADLRYGLRQACAAAGVSGVTPYTLRHTSATWMAQAGVDLWAIAGVLGNSMEMVQKVYAHHHPDFLLDAVNRRRA